jgi:hypothetical protein
MQLVCARMSTWLIGMQVALCLLLLLPWPVPTQKVPKDTTSTCIHHNMPWKWPHNPIRSTYTRVHKELVIYQFYTLGRTTTQIAIDLRMKLRSVQRTIHMWNEIGEVCRDRKYKGRTPLMSAGAIDVRPGSASLVSLFAYFYTTHSVWLLYWSIHQICTSMKFRND